jgi:hypothetical protein
MATKSTAVATIDEALTSSLVVQYLKDPTSVDVLAFREDPEAVAARINAQILEADSVEALFGGKSDTVQGKTYTNRPFQLRKVLNWQPSDQEGAGLPFFGVFEIATPDGEILTMTCGARGVVLRAAKADAEGWLPVWVKITEGTKTEAGFIPLDLVGVDAPATLADGSSF